MLVYVRMCVCSFWMKILCKQRNEQRSIHGQCTYTNSCSTMYSESTRCKVRWGRRIGSRGELPTHAIAAAVVGPRFWLSPVDIAINFHAYLLFCRTSLIIKNKSIFNGVFEKQTLLVRASVRFGSSCFGIVRPEAISAQISGVKMLRVLLGVIYSFCFWLYFLFAPLIGHTTACWQGIQ